jgi:esterase/lipase superfamily enzyme
VVATTRERAAPDVNVFTTERAQALNFAEFTIATPPTQNPDGSVKPLGSADLARSFVTVDQAVLTRAEFSQRVAPRGAAASRQNVVIFAHGFNTNFQEALFRLVQMSADARIEGTPVLFSWPSQARVTGYRVDRDSVALSRDDFAELLTLLAANPRVGRVTVVAHSLGGWLVVEALQKLKVAGKRAVINRLNVVLVSPDIDVDAFRQQLEVIGPLSPPMTLLVATDDRALATSRRIAGSRARVGALDVNDPRVRDAALRARVRIVDISDVSASSRFNHDRHVNLAALYPVLASSATNDPDLDRRNPGVFVLDAMSATIANPFTVADRTQGAD